MISVIISTYKKDTFNQFAENLSKSIGVEYELIAIDNPSKYSLCEAYNIGIKESKFPYLCFVHEDVTFKTPEWGKHIVSVMQNDTNIGLIGVAGSKFKSSFPLSGWGQGPSLKKYKRGHIIHKIGNKPEEYVNFDIYPDSAEVEDVVCVDGVFLLAKKEIFDTCKFDEQNLTGFHGYDTDISLQVFFQGFRVVVDRRLLLIHSSGGNYNREYTLANKIIFKKWRKKLPIAVDELKMNKFKLYKTDIINWYHSGVSSIKRKLNLI